MFVGELRGHDDSVRDESGGSVSSFLSGGGVQSTAAAGGGIGVAVDATGNVWSLSTPGNALTEFSNTGGLLGTFGTGGVLADAAALAVDGANTIWIVNGNGSIYTATPANQYTITTGAWANVADPAGLSIDNSGDLWISDAGGNAVVEVLGAAAPVVSPLAAATAAGDPGTRP